MKNMIERAKQVLQEEADAIIRMKDLINEDFEKSLEVILNAKGRIIVTGIGKSAIIGQKIVATFNSTGLPWSPPR
jgi:arabinose-5-phosphate isomerase